MGVNTHKLVLFIGVLCVKSNNLSFGLNRVSAFMAGSPVILILKWLSLFGRGGKSVRPSKIPTKSV